MAEVSFFHLRGKRLSAAAIKELLKAGGGGGGAALVAAVGGGLNDLHGGIAANGSAHLCVSAAGGLPIRRRLNNLPHMGASRKRPGVPHFLWGRRSCLAAGF
jgi:hypothetical protein